MIVFFIKIESFHPALYLSIDPPTLHHQSSSPRQSSAIRMSPGRKRKKSHMQLEKIIPISICSPLSSSPSAINPVLVMTVDYPVPNNDAMSSSTRHRHRKKIYFETLEENYAELKKAYNYLLEQSSVMMRAYNEKIQAYQKRVEELETALEEYSHFAPGFTPPESPLATLVYDFESPEDEETEINIWS